MRLETPTTRLLKRVQSWQKAIVSHLAVSSAFEAAAIDRTTQNFILVILVFYLSEQRGIWFSDRLPELARSDRLYLRLVALWQDWQTHFKQDIGFNLSPAATLPDSLIRSILEDLYQPDPAQFSALPSAVLGQVYEAMLGGSVPTQSSLHRRYPPQKAGGIYYTPSPIVQFMVEQTIGASLQSSPGSPLWIVDPACGSGAFLAAVYQFLLDHWQDHPTQFPGKFCQLSPDQKQGQLSPIDRQQILLNCIYGVDLDPQAVTVTKLTLWLKLLEETPEPMSQALPDLNQNLQVGNALIGTDCRDFPAPVYPLDWEMAFPEIMRSGGFDVVLGNPPYLDSEWMTTHLPAWRRYCNSHYRTATGNWDLFCVFIEKTLTLCRAGGMLSFVVPNKLTSADYAAQTRSLLLQETHLQIIRDYAQVPVFAASVYPLVYVAKHVPAPTRLQVRCEVMQDLVQVERSGWLTFDFSDSSNSSNVQTTRPWQISVFEQQAALLQRLSETFPLLGSIAPVYGAATVAEAYALQPWIQNCETPAPDDWRLVNSGTIDRYSIRWGQKPTRYLGQSYLHPIIPLVNQQQLSLRRQTQATEPKIIVSGMSRYLKCTLDATGNLLAGKSTCIVLSASQNSGLDLHYLLGLLNSKLLSFYFAHRFEGNRLQGGYFRVGTLQVRQLPIAIPDLMNSEQQQCYQEIISLVKDLNKQKTMAVSQKRILFTTPQQEPKLTTNHLDREIDRLVYKLYRVTDEEAVAIEQTQSSRDSQRQT